MPVDPHRGRPPRHLVHVPCQAVRERDFRLVAAKIVDLSLGGMLVGPALPVLTGDRILVSFRSPRWGVWVDAEAIVARVVHGRRRTESGRAPRPPRPSRSLRHA
jgi:hypothetical protein